jgi:hypothetical protein
VSEDNPEGFTCPQCKSALQAVVSGARAGSRYSHATSVEKIFISIGRSTTKGRYVFISTVWLGGCRPAQHRHERHAGEHPNHMLAISVNGMHEVDLRLWIKGHPNGPLAQLARCGTTFSSACTTAPSDTFLRMPMFVLTPEQRQDIAYILSLKTNK